MATVKLASLFIRTLSKPLAASIKNQAKNHPKFRNVCISIAQTYHSVDISLKRRFLDYNSDVVRPLNDAKAVEVGANFIGESIIFTVAIVGEIYRNSRNTAKRKEQVDLKIEQLVEQMQQIQDQLAQVVAKQESIVQQVVAKQESIVQQVKEQSK